jgi:hypothetical protein
VILNQPLNVQINYWVGYQKDKPTSSGLHHDFHDNLYLLIDGYKEFTLFSPKDALNLYTNGTIEKVWPNGYIQYAPDLRGDGAALFSVAKWKLQKAEEELEGCEAESKPTDEAEEKVACALDELLRYENDQDDEEETLSESDDFEDSDEDEASLNQQSLSKPSTARDAKKIKLESDVPSEPNSFSKIDLKALRSCPLRTSQFPLLSQATKVTLKLSKSEALYLPASWFHEVTSGSDSSTQEGVHTALNYWMCPPTVNSFEEPYEDKYWEEYWNGIQELIGRRQALMEKTTLASNFSDALQHDII